MGFWGSIFGSVIVGEDYEDGLIYEDTDRNDHIEYVNGWILCTEPDDEEYETPFEQGHYSPPKHKWWGRA